MDSIQVRERKLKEIEELARGWGEILASEAFPDGVGLDVDLFAMEEFAVTAAKSLVRGAVETMSERQADELAESAECPGCGRACHLDHRGRELQIRGGAAKITEPVARCSACRRDFFPSASGTQDRRAAV
jgi:hypothetical protein